MFEREPVSMRPAIIGPFGPAQLACLRSWHALGWHALFIQIGEHRAPSLLNGLLSGYLHLPEETEESTRVKLVHDFLDGHNATGLTCLSYNLMDWLHRNAASLPSTVALWIATPEMLPALRSKCLQVEVAREVGLAVLHSTSVDNAASISIAPEHFPLVLRPDDETRISPPFKMILAKDQREVGDFIGSRTHVGCALIAQRFINGPNLVVHGACNRRGEHVHLAGFMARRKFEGVSLTIEPVSLPAKISEVCRAFVERIGYVGIYHFDFLLDPENGDYYFLEINGRLGGTTGKVLACGYDEPRHLVEAYCDTGSNYATYAPSQKKPICTNKRGATKAMLELVRGKRTIFDYPGKGPLRDSLDLASGLVYWRDEVFRVGHFRSAFAYTMHASMPRLDLRRRTPERRENNMERSSAEKGLVIHLKHGLQRILRAGLGHYQVFHIVSYTAGDQGQGEDDLAQVTIESSQSDEGYRFWVKDAETRTVEVCKCNFWTSTTSNRIRGFIPLKNREAELLLLETHRDYRNRGLAKKLVISASATMLSEGFNGLYARIWHSNKASLRTVFGAGWQYAYTIVEIYPIGKRLRFRLKLPRQLAG